MGEDACRIRLHVVDHDLSQHLPEIGGDGDIAAHEEVGLGETGPLPINSTTANAPTSRALPWAALMAT